MVNGENREKSMNAEFQRQPDLGNGYFINPVLGGDYPDPSVVRVGKDYYMTHSCFNNGPGLLIWHSQDLVNWEPICNAIATHAGNIMAPDFIYHNGFYFIYYPANKTNWVVRAESPYGPWSEPVDLRVGHIDPGHVVDQRDGKRYLYVSGCYLVPLSEDGLSVTGELVEAYAGWEFPEEWKVGAFALESPKLTYKDGYYYLTTAEGGTAGPATSHMVVSARSKTPLGPWENSPYNPVIHTWSREERWLCKGHGTLVDTPEGDWYMMYHAYEKDYLTLGRQTLLEPIEWTEDGWFRVPEGIDAAQPIKKPKGTAVEHGLRLSDDFSGERLGLQWRFYGEHKTNRYKIGDGLAMECQGTSPSDCSPMLCITTDHAYEVEVHVTLTEGAEGGLILYYNKNSYYGIGFTEGNLYPLRRALRMAPYEWNGREAYLRIVNDHHELTMYYSKDGIAWKKMVQGMECSGCHHNTFGGFASVRAGIYAAGQGKVIFRNFKYRALP